MAGVSALERRRKKALRILAWEIAGVVVKDKIDGRETVGRADPFPCHTWCHKPNGEAVTDLQIARRCTLPGFARPWGEPGPQDRARLSLWMGAPPKQDGKYIDRHPAEEVEDGCPGGWSRCTFASSFAGRWRRARTSDGGHDVNPRIGPDTPDHILDALAYFEGEEGAALANFRQRAYGR